MHSPAPSGLSVGILPATFGGSGGPPTSEGARPATTGRSYVPTSVSFIAALVLLGLAGLPLAVWLDLGNLSERTIRGQAEALDSAINSMRSFYSSNVVARVRGFEGKTQVVHNYMDVPGAIPIPATLSLELGSVITGDSGNVQYRFFSDYPFANRAPHAFDDFERRALSALRRDPKLPDVVDISGSIFDRRIRLATPVVMAAECVSCHNAHPESPKRDWKIGDVRGIQEVSVRQPLAANIFAFKYLLIYLVCAGTGGLALVMMQRRQALAIGRINRELQHANSFLAGISLKIAKYLSPQLYRSIFSGEKEVAIATERKKLTIFFSDIADFTATTERLQPEELTALLNEYLTEMSGVAVAHGGTVNKFIGDAMLVFFGDPETRGSAEDAKACLAMAVELRRRIGELNDRWRRRGIEQPFRVRMGINTGFCNVGNFGSSDRMEYTIIGAEANLAARLQSIAEPGSIVISHETYTLVRDTVRARLLPPVTVKGINRPVVPYVVDGLLGDVEQRGQVISEHATGLDLFLDTAGLNDQAAARARNALQEALAALEQRPRQTTG
jgi:adenylate cyclase